MKGLICGLRQIHTVKSLRLWLDIRLAIRLSIQRSYTNSLDTAGLHFFLVSINIFTAQVAFVTYYSIFLYFPEEGLFYAMLIGAPLWANLGECLSNDGQRKAILNYNNQGHIEEKHIIIAVDQFFKFNLAY
jgi:hypothetical protein